MKVATISIVDEKTAAEAAGRAAPAIMIILGVKIDVRVATISIVDVKIVAETAEKAPPPPPAAMPPKLPAQLNLLKDLAQIALASQS